MRYKYKARTKEGKLQKGMIEASSRKGALAVLEKHGLYTTSLKEAERIGILEKKIIFRRVSSSDLVAFTRQLGVMLKSAILPVEALRAQVAQIENPDFREKILKISEVEHQPLKINKYKTGELFLDNNQLAVQCGEDALVIKKLQLSGKKEMLAEEFIRGHKNFIGKILG